MSIRATQPDLEACKVCRRTKSSSSFSSSQTEVLAGEIAHQYKAAQPDPEVLEACKSSLLLLLSSSASSSFKKRFWFGETVGGQYISTQTAPSRNCLKEIKISTDDSMKASCAGDLLDEVLYHTRRNTPQTHKVNRDAILVGVCDVHRPEINPRK